MLNFEEFSINENNKEPRVKKGEEVKVTLSYLKDKPNSTVEAYDDSSFNKHFEQDTFSFLFGGDMMMIAKWDGEKWISE